MTVLVGTEDDLAWDQWERWDTLTVWENVGMSVSPTREDYAGVHEIYEFSIIGRDRGDSAALFEYVGVGSTPAREGYAAVHEIYEFSIIGRDRAGFAGVADNVTFGFDAWLDVDVYQLGWGHRLLPNSRVGFTKLATTSFLYIQESVQVRAPNPETLDTRNPATGFATVFEEVDVPSTTAP